MQSNHPLTAVAIALLIIACLTSAPRARTSATEPLALLYDSAATCFSKGQLTEAATLFDRVDRADPKFRDSRKRLAETLKFIGIELYSRSQLDSAITTLDRASTLDPGNSEIAGYLDRARNDRISLDRLAKGQSAPGGQISTPTPTPTDQSAPRPVTNDDLLRLDHRVRDLQDSVKILAALVKNSRLTRPDTKRPAEPEAATKAKKTTVDGFIDGSYSYISSNSENSFQVDQVEFDLSFTPTEPVYIRTDLEYLPDSVESIEAAVEQAYVSYALGGTLAWEFAFGRFNAPIGGEPIEPTDRHLFSRSFLRQYALPTNLTGLSVTVWPTERLALSALAVNGWDRNTDNNSDKTFGLQLDFEASPRASLGAALLTGPERANNNHTRRSIIDAGFSLSPTDKIHLSGEVTWGVETEVDALSGADGNWQGWLLTGRYDASTRFGLALRFDWLNDDDGLLTGFSQTLHSFTIAPQLTLTHGLWARAEWRYDHSDSPFFPDSDTSLDDTRSTVAAEILAAF